MKVSGDAVLNATPDRVWSHLTDPAVLVRTIPGCHKLEETDPDCYRMTVSAGVASIKGTYQGDVRLTDQDEPSSLMLRASGSGAPGTVSTDVLVRLDDLGDGRTRVSYDADAVVGGMIGGVGQRMLTGVAKKTAGEFFKNVDEVLAGRGPTNADAATAPGVFELPEAAPASMETLLRGAVIGAALALAGVVVGALIGRRR